MQNLEERGHLLTEQVNPNSENLDQLSSIELVDLFNQEDAQTLSAIAHAREQLARAIDIAAESCVKEAAYFTSVRVLPGVWGCLMRPSVRPPSARRQS